MRSERGVPRPHICRAAVIACVVMSACAPGRIALPTDPGTPLTDYQQIHAEVSTACRGVRTMTAELSLSGRANGARIRGRVIAGFARPGAMRLEGVAPFGGPVFVLAARQGEATLLLPREHRVVRDAPADEVLGALTGIALAPADLEALLTGCVVPEPRVLGGRLHGNGWASIDLDGGAMLFLKRQSRGWSLRAATRGQWEIEYPAWTGAFPSVVRLRSANAGVVDVAASVSQIEVNVDVDPSAFMVVVPPTARPMTVEELRNERVGSDTGE